MRARPAACLTLLAVLAIAQSGVAAPHPAARRAPPAARIVPAAQRSVAAVLTRSGAENGPLLRDLVGETPQPADEGFAGYAETRAAIRACHAGRYAASAARMLDGIPRPLRDC
jgi:hypothetical protein